MKPLLILSRIFLVGIFWSIFFLEGIRVIMLKNWRFDIIRTEHWNYAWDLWLSGWVISDAKEWAFVLIILTFIPLWLTGWAALSLVKWENIFSEFLKFPSKLFKNLFFKPVNVIAHTAGIKKIKKKKSYKEVRPKSIRAPIDEKIYQETNTPIMPTASNLSTSLPIISPTQEDIKENKSSGFDHSLFKFDEDDDFDFDFDAFTDKEEKQAPKEETKEASAPVSNNNQSRQNKNNKNDKKQNNKNDRKQNNSNKPDYQSNKSSNSNSNSTLDVIRQKGYETINSITLKNNIIDFIGVSENQICMCLVDKEAGDWLADEERFNDEEPLWFSESSHRISPVRKIDVAKQALIEKLDKADMSFDIKAYVVIQTGNIINAEDMLDIWDDLDVNVTRIDRGTPKELKLFSKSLEASDTPISKDKLEKIKKILRG